MNSIFHVGKQFFIVLHHTVRNIGQIIVIHIFDKLLICWCFVNSDYEVCRFINFFLYS